jgi:penicillin-binding protein 1A
VGYDSNQSLGEKETGARAALPIWMTVMRVAIAGKDEERFPGDEQTSQKQKAAVAVPAKPPANPAASGSVVKPPAQTVSGVSPTKPVVKPALPPQPVPAKPYATVRPALPGKANQ